MEQSNEMETMNIKKLALKISIPMIMSMIAIALYGIVDTAFVSRISDDALTTVSLAVPMQAIIAAIALGIGIGVNSILAKSLGQKDEKKVTTIIGCGFVFAFISWISIVLTTYFGTKTFFSFFTDNERIINLGHDYFSIIGIFSIGSIFQILFEKILEAFGKAKTSMIVQFSGTIVNLILDPILIFGLLGFPVLGIRGAAIATVIGQTIGMTIGLISLIKNRIFKFNYLVNINADKEIIIEIFKVGLPTMILEAVTSFIALFLNKILITFSESAVSVWGIYYQLQRFVFIIIYGLNYGMIPIVAYNLGAKQRERVKQAIKFFLQLAIGVAVIGELLFLLIPGQLINFFEITQEVYNIAVPAFRILAIGFSFAAVAVVLSATFQAFGNGTYSLIVNLSRKLIFVVPIIFILKSFVGIYSIWIAFTVAEIITMLIAICLFRKTSKNIIEKI